jgi:hypothetical protein
LTEAALTNAELDSLKAAAAAAMTEWNLLRTITPTKDQLNSLMAAVAAKASLASITIPAAVAIIEDEAFKACTELEDCSMDKDRSLVRIETSAFGVCNSLRFVDIPGWLNQSDSTVLQSHIFCVTSNLVLPIH